MQVNQKDIRASRKDPAAVRYHMMDDTISITQPQHKDPHKEGRLPHMT